MKRWMSFIVFLCCAGMSIAQAQLNPGPAIEANEKEITQKIALKDLELEKIIGRRDQKLLRQEAASLQSASLASITQMLNSVSNQDCGGHGSGGSGSASCWDQCTKEGYGSSTCSSRCGTSSSGGSSSCWDQCSKEGYGSSTCSSRCGTSNSGGSSSCWDQCSKEGYGSSTCASRCGTSSSGGSGACWTQCTKEGYGSSTCASRCGTK